VIDQRRPSILLCWVVALLAACPVLVNVLKTYINDGESSTFTVACSLLEVALLGLVALMRGVSLPQRPALAAFAIMTALFWGEYLVLCYFFPSRANEKMMDLLPAYAVLWVILPMALILLTRHVLDTQRVFSAMLIVVGIYLILLLVRFVLGIGKYHAGRWSPGESLEAIRVGRYAAAAVLIYLVALIAPQTSRFNQIIALIGIGPALFLTVVANARGPWLALLITLVLVAPILGGVFLRRLRDDVRVLAASAIVVGLAAVGVLVAMTKSE